MIEKGSIFAVFAAQWASINLNWKSLTKFVWENNTSAISLIVEQLIFKETLSSCTSVTPLNTFILKKISLLRWWMLIDNDSKCVRESLNVHLGFTFDCRIDHFLFRGMAIAHTRKKKTQVWIQCPLPNQWVASSLASTGCVFNTFRNSKCSIVK